MMSNELSRMYAKHNPGVVVPSIDELAEWAASHIAGLENQVALLRTPLGEIAIERARQDDKWGGAAHDDQHTTADFVQLIQDYAGWSRVMDGMNSPDKARRRLIQVAALALAGVESIDRKTIGVTLKCTEAGAWVRAD